MKKFLFAMLLPLAMLAITSGCKKDWLTPPPENTLIQSDSTYTKVENAEKFVNACYAWNIEWGQSVFSWIG